MLAGSAISTLDMVTGAVSGALTVSSGLRYLVPIEAMEI